MDEEIETSAEREEAAVKPRSHTVKCNPDGSITSQAEDIPDGLAEKPYQQKSPAEWAYERIILYIQNFEKLLDNEHEVAMGFAGGDMGVMKIEGLGYFDPDVVTFYGSDHDGTKTQLIQHVTQMNVMLRALPKNSKNKAPNRIGFRLAADLKES